MKNLIFVFLCLSIFCISCGSSKKCPKKQSWEYKAKFGFIEDNKLNDTLCLE